MKLILGSELNEDQKKEVTRAFIYRKTVENKAYIDMHGLSYKHGFDFVAIMTDKEWLENYAFWITDNGRLAGNRYRCVPKDHMKFYGF